MAPLRARKRRGVQRSPDGNFSRRAEETTLLGTLAHQCIERDQSSGTRRRQSATFARIGDGELAAAVDRHETDDDHHGHGPTEHTVETREAFNLWSERVCPKERSFL